MVNYKNILTSTSEQTVIKMTQFPPDKGGVFDRVFPLGGFVLAEGVKVILKSTIKCFLSIPHHN
jgi:hypothetical protein